MAQVFLFNAVACLFVTKSPNLLVAVALVAVALAKGPNEITIIQEKYHRPVTQKLLAIKTP